MSPLTVMLVVIVLALLWVAFRAFRVQVILPAAARALSARGHDDAALHSLERGVKLWTPLGERNRYDLRFYWAYLLMKNGRYEEAEAQCRMLLAIHGKPYLQAKTRLRLADCLDDQKRTEEAAQERAVVEKLTGDTKDINLILERAALLTDHNKHDEATKLFQQVLAQAGQIGESSRAQVEVKLALSAWHSGHYPVALEAAESALGRKVLVSPMNRVAHNMASLALSSLSRWDEALVHTEASLALARTEGNQDTIAELLSQVGNLKVQLGQLNEAMQLANEAVPMSLTGRRLSSLLQAEVLRCWGRYDDALTALESVARAPALAIPLLAARTQATVALGKARLYNLKGNPERALEFLERAQEGFAGDAKFETWILAERLYSQALQGDRPRYDAILLQLEEKLATLPDDPSTQQVGLGARAESANALGNFDEALPLWESYLALTPAPIDCVRAWYGLGVTQHGRHCPTQAQAAWKQATESTIDCFYTSLAKKRLAELEQAALKNPT